MKGFWGATGSFLRWASGSRGAKVGEWVTWRLWSPYNHPAASLHPALDAALPDTCLQPLLTQGCPLAVLLCVG